MAYKCTYIAVPADVDVPIQLHARVEFVVGTFGIHNSRQVIQTPRRSHPPPHTLHHMYNPSDDHNSRDRELDLCIHSLITVVVVIITPSLSLSLSSVLLSFTRACV